MPGLTNKGFNMKNQKELIAYYAKNLVKVIAEHGAESQYTNYAFHQLQAAKRGYDVGEICEYASAVVEYENERELDDE